MILSMRIITYSISTQREKYNNTCLMHGCNLYLLRFNSTRFERTVNELQLRACDGLKQGGIALFASHVFRKSHDRVETCEHHLPWAKLPPYMEICALCCCVCDIVFCVFEISRCFLLLEMNANKKWWVFHYDINLKHERALRTWFNIFAFISCAKQFVLLCRAKHFQ